jgi:S1-C subfamily serine protease
MLSVTCPSCRANLHLSEQLAGKTIRCKQCQQIFTVGALPKPQPPEASPRPIPTVRPVSVEPANRPDPYREGLQSRPGSVPPPVLRPVDRPPPRRTAPREESGISFGWIIGGVTAGSVVFLGLLIGGILIFRHWSSSGNDPKKQEAVAQAAEQIARAGKPDDGIARRPAIKEDEVALPAAREEAAPQAPAAPNPQPGFAPAPQGGPPGPQRDFRGTAIPARLLDEVKKATVFVKVDQGFSGGSGSGFLMKRDGLIGYVVTNHHVVEGESNEDFGPFFGPRRVRAAAPPVITAVFGSGTAQELSVRAEVLASDKQRDLAILQVRGIPNLPVPIDISRPPELVETTPVYLFGYPLGELLDARRRNPAITVSPGSVSALRRDGRGRLDHIQLDIDMNPGNSGGPVVDGQGRLVGIAVSGIRGTRINRVIPPEKLTEVVAGRISSAELFRAIVFQGKAEVLAEHWAFDSTYRVRSSGSGNVRLTTNLLARARKGVALMEIEVQLVDPLRKIREVAIRYQRMEEGMAAPRANADGTWPALAGSQKLNLNIDGQKASATLELSDIKVTDRYQFQVEFQNPDGQTVYTQAHAFAFDRPKSAPANNPPVAGAKNPPAGDPGAAAAPAGQRQAPPPALTVSRALTKNELDQALAALKSENAFDRKGAAEVLSQAEPKERRPEVAKALEPMLDDPDHFARQAGIKAMGHWGTKDSVPLLLKLLTHKDIFTRRSAIGALGELRDDRGIVPVAQCLVDFQTRGDAGKALEAIGPKAEKEVAKLLTHSDIFLRAFVCGILKTIGTKESVPALENIVRDEDIHVRTHVAGAAKEAIQAIQAREEKRS